MQRRQCGWWSRETRKGESSKVLCGRSSDRTRVDSPRQLPTDHDYAVSTREYQSDQPSQNYLGHNLRCLLRVTKRRKQLLVVDRSFHIRTVVGTAQPVCLAASATQRRRHHSAMNLRERQNHGVSSHDLGWTATRCLAAGELFSLTSPFIERDSRRLACRVRAAFREEGVISMGRRNTLLK